MASQSINTQKNISRQMIELYTSFTYNTISLTCNAISLTYNTAIQGYETQKESFEQAIQ